MYDFVPDCLTMEKTWCILFSRDDNGWWKMIKSISNKLLQYLIKADVIDKSEDALAYYKYGLEITISSLLNIVLIFSIGIISGQLIESILFLICFIPLRRFTGGYHANSYLKCNILFSVLFIILLLIFNLTVTRVSFYGCIIMLVFSIAIFLSECPMEHSNKPLTDSQKKKNKCLSIILGLLYGAIGVMSKVLSYNIGVLFLYTLVLISLLVIVATFQKLRKGEI